MSGGEALDANVVWWNVSSMYVLCPYYEGIHQHGFRGNYASTQFRLSHCDTGYARDYRLKFPINIGTNYVGYEIDKQRALFIAGGADPSEFFPAPEESLEEASFMLEIKSRPKWSEATETTHRDEQLSQIPMFKKRIEVAEDDMVHGRVRNVREYLATSAESNIFLHGSQTFEIGPLYSSDKDECGSTIEKNIQTTGRTALHLAACKAFPEMVELLLQKGADPNARDINGRIPLMEAALWGRVENTKVLLKYGANRELECVRNGRRIRPEDFAKPLKENTKDRYQRSFLYREVIYEEDQDRREILHLLEGGAERSHPDSASLASFSFTRSSGPEKLALLAHFDIPNDRKTVGVLYRGHNLPPVAAMSGWAHPDDSDMNIQISGKTWTPEVCRLSKFIGYDLATNEYDHGQPGQFYACHAEKQLLAFFVHRHLFLPFEIGEDVDLAELNLDELPEEERGRRRLDRQHEDDLLNLRNAGPPISLKGAKIMVCRPVCPDCKRFSESVNKTFGLTWLPTMQNLRQAEIYPSVTGPRVYFQLALA
ncbi:unnamed protein product [Penicillium palitans]